MQVPLSTALFALLFLAPATAAQVAPFTAARHAGDDGYEVHVEEEWYALVSLDGLEAARLRAHCEATYGGRALKRFSEDLLEVLEGLGHAPGDTVDLVLLRFDDGERVELAGVPLTLENRKCCWEFNYNREAGPVRLSSMASFRPDGRRYDGLGIEPEVLVMPAPGDFTGSGDDQLAVALAILRGE